MLEYCLALEYIDWIKLSHMAAFCDNFIPKTGLCSTDDDCFSSQCCALSLVCIPKSSQICGKVMSAITDGLNIIKAGMVEFGRVVTETSLNLIEAAARGIYNFFSKLFSGGSASKKCSGCVTPLQWWLMGSSPKTYFFIRGGASLSYKKWWGIGGKDATVKNEQPLISVDYSYWTNAYWWYVSDHNDSVLNTKVLDGMTNLDTSNIVFN